MPSTKPIRHGTCGGYTNRGCRCVDCREAQSKYAVEYQRRRRGIPSKPAADPAKLQVYLWAFEQHLRAGSDPEALDAAKDRTDTIMRTIGRDSTSDPSRDWMGRLLFDLRHR